MKKHKKAENWKLVGGIFLIVIFTIHSFTMVTMASEQINHRIQSCELFNNHCDTLKINFQL